MYLLDTNVLSELRRPDKAHAKVRAWATSLPVAQFYLSAITVLELELGVQLMERKDAAQRRGFRGSQGGPVRPLGLS